VCQRTAQGTVFCEEHQPVPPAANPYAGPSASPYVAPYTATPGAPSPGLAFILGLIPGVGAIYNGQYAKGLVHVVLLGFLISILNSDGARGLEPLIGLLIPLLFFYMAFEAYHTAAKRLRGEVVDEFSGLFPVGRRGPGLPVGPILLIILGFIFLLDTMDVVRLYYIVRYWPVFLILLGAYLLYLRLRGEDSVAGTEPEAPSER
jgi:hypothetical protein